MQLTSSTTYIPFLCKALQYTATSVAQCIVCADDDGMPVAGVVYDSFNGATVHAHIWVDAERRPCREWYSAIFDYPFNRLGVRKIIGQVNSGNGDARKLDEHFGFVLEAEIKDYYEEGTSLLVYTLTKEQCRILNAPGWRKVNQQIARAV